MNYSLTIYRDHCDQELLQAELVGRLFPASVRGVSHDDEDLYEEKAERVALGIVLYPRPGTNGDILPPFLLIEPVDDPDTAEQRYREYGVVLYVGRFLLNDSVLSDTVEVKASREALDLWYRLLPQSGSHHEAYTRYKRWQADLLQPTQSAMQQMRVSEALYDPLHSVWESLSLGGEQDRIATLRRLQRADPNEFPPSTLLPCLTDPSAEVRTLTLRVLETRADQLPVQQLIAVARGAEIQARLAAISLLGKIGGEEAMSELLVACWSRNAWIRCAALSALVEADADDPDVLENLLIARRKDEASAVRQIVSALIDQLGGLAMVEARAIAHLGLS